jgi:hypothetical protein
MWKLYAFYYGISLLHVYIFHTQHAEFRGLQRGCTDMSLFWGAQIPSWDKKRDRTPVVKTRNEGRKNFLKGKQRRGIYYFHPQHIHIRSSLESRIYTPAFLRRDISHNRNVNMIIVYDGRVHKSDQNCAWFHIKRSQLMLQTSECDGT